MLHGAAGLLLAAAAGYWVLERAETHKKSLRRAGRFIGWVIILTGLLGGVCGLLCPGGKAGYWKRGGWCPLTPKTATDVLPP